jgi:tRNA threonylcarbamoyladenosine biosynthesis protein TsaB
MNVLALDTATLATVAGVLRADGEAFERRDDPPPGERPAHGGRLLVLAEQALADAGLRWEELSRIAVGVGPGGFTGLRIGIATARALAQARGLPLVAVGSLHSLALGAAGAGPVLAVLDARRGEAFAAAWGPAAPNELGEPLLASAALAPETLAERVRGLASAPLAVGDGALRFRAQLEAAGATVPPDGDGAHRISAVNVCRLGAAGTPTDRDALLPDYLREPDAVLRR